MAKRRKTLQHRRQAALILGQLRRVSRVHVGSGEILDAEPWLKVLAAMLSSVPPPSLETQRRNPKAGEFRLTEDTLTRAAIECRVSFTRAQVASQVRDTLAWRKSEASRAGEAIYRPMKPDTIGKLLGVTEETRRDAQAWLIGTYDGNAKDRAQAYREREKKRKRDKRAAEGAKSYSQSDAKLKPWEAVGMSRRTWYRKKADGFEPETSATSKGRSVCANIGTKTSATNKGSNSYAEVGTKTSVTKTSAPNKGRGTKTSAPNYNKPISQQTDASTYGLASPQPTDFLARRERLSGPADCYTLSCAIAANGLAATALRTLAATIPPRDCAEANTRIIAKRAEKAAQRKKGGRNA